ncbi:MAG: protein kinase [Arthrobacter sp.]
MHKGQFLNGRYELIERLGQGGMGDVWKAHDQVLPRYVAIKGLSEESVAGGGHKRRLEDEADTLAGLRHTRIVPIIDKFTEDDQLYLVMEFIEGTDLQRAGETGSLTDASKIAILTGVLEALTYLHEETTVVHRDLKPANVLLDHKKRPYVADFGIARSRLDTQATQTQGIIGSRPYMAPEVLDGKTATPASDMWAFGAIALWLFTGRTPHAGIPEGNFAGSLTDDIRAALSDRRPSASDLLESFLRVQRDGVTSAVPTVVHHESATRPVPSVRQPANTPAERRRPRWIPVLLLVVAVAAISTLALTLLRPGALATEPNSAATAPSARTSTPSEASTASETPTPSKVPTPTPTVSETPRQNPAPPTSTPAATSSPPAAISREISDGRIEISSSRGKLGPGLYDASTSPGYEPYVYTAAGRLGSEGCYAQWRVVNNGILLDTRRTPCERSPISSEVYWPRVDYEPGSVEVTADITTDWGASSKLSVTFEMVKN